jgi:hypothetical protein
MFEHARIVEIEPVIWQHGRNLTWKIQKKEGSTFFRVCCFFTFAERQGLHKGEQTLVTQQKLDVHSSILLK